MQSACKLCRAVGRESVFDNEDEYYKHIFAGCPEYEAIFKAYSDGQRRELRESFPQLAEVAEAEADVIQPVL
jgi:xanthine/CO dehydrogenase XdhC/CoxF family maturation factor